MSRPWGIRFTSWSFELQRGYLHSLFPLPSLRLACNLNNISMRKSILLLPLGIGTILLQIASGADNESASAQQQAAAWRAEHRIIDLHQHIDCTTQHVARTVKIMDAAGLGIGVNLSGGTVTRPGAGGSVRRGSRNTSAWDFICGMAPGS